MEDNNNRNDIGEGRHSQEEQAKSFESNLQKDAHEAKAGGDKTNAAAASQRAPENGRDSNIPGSESGSMNARNADEETEEDYEGDGEEEDIIPNPDDFDEGDYEDTTNTEDIEEYDGEDDEINDAAKTPRL